MIINGNFFYQKIHHSHPYNKQVKDMGYYDSNCIIDGWFRFECP